ncbi:MAG: GMC family oxidoreductase [Steroidobacteraceae bacterium]
MNGSRETDVLIVGSGAVGSSLAARLAAAGHAVLVLEAGPARSNQDLVSSAIWARRLKWGGSTVIETGDKPVGHTFNAGYGTGGSALHHYAVWPRLHAEDFRMHSEFGTGLDWPIGYEDLQAHYDAVQDELGISGDASQEKWRPPGAPYPLPPTPVFAQGAAIARGFDRLGLATSPLPLAITTTPWRGRPACLWDGWCDAGCPIGALANPLAVHLPAALAHGASLLNDATVLRVLTREDGRRATGVEYADATGQRITVNARLVILAAFTVQNARLLLASRNARHAQGLGNDGDMLGRYITSHTAGLIFGLFEERTDPYLGAFGGQLLNQDHYGKRSHAQAEAFGSYQWMIAQAVKPVDLLGIAPTRPDLTGSKLHDFMKRAAGHFATMTAVVEDLPLAGNRVTLAGETDTFGVPLASVHHDLDPASRALWQSSLAQGRKVFEAAGASEVWTGPGGSMHIMGGTIMGKTPADSVTNSHGQVHGIANLFVAGPGLFPTSGGVNPTFTAQALAHRSGEFIVQHFEELIA